MKQFRTTLFWLHLLCGVVAGLVILVMSATGVILALKPQIQDWIERDVRYVTADGAPRLGAYQLLDVARRARPDVSPQSLALARDPSAAATISLGRGGNLYVNPYSGAILGTGSAATVQFFQTMTNWHRYLGATGESRAVGRSLTGACNLAFLILGITGLYIWWPRQLSLQHVKAIVWFRRTSTGRARDFNWHNTIGFWCLIPILAMTVSGTVLSYSWASNLVYRLSGSPVPAGRGGGPGGGPAGAAGGVEGGGRQARRGEQAATRGRGGRGANNLPAREGASRTSEARAAGAREDGGRGSDGNQAGPAVIPAEIDRIWARAEQRVSTWSLLSMRLPNREDGPVAFTITDGANWNAFARSNLTLNAASGDVIQWQPYEGNNLGQKVRGWLRFGHTGELGGLAGQIIAGVGCFGGVLLVGTGLSLALRRLWNWSLWRRLRWSKRKLSDAAVSTAPSAPPAPAIAREALME
ncbi:MAG: PepSY-associated TM helix domain-containing protein [Acidobacteriota bacterium]